VTSTEVPDSRTQPWELEYRIPTNTIPRHYDLYLHPDLETGTFKGTVDILVEVTSPMTFLVTHCKNMNITQTEVVSLASNKSVELVEYFEYKPNEFWVMRPRVALKPGSYSIKLAFDGSLENKIVGFYKSVYTTAGGEKRSIATSKFQPTDARAAFPCFDEPSFKSTFTLTLVRPSDGYLALSNMPQESQTSNAPLRGLTEVRFERSVPMVTYLVCFIVCDFQFVETTTQDNKLFRVYSTPDQINRTHYARDIGVSILNFFEKYFEVEYPLPKQDMIAIPDFVSGAMEHWGLITYRETNLLYDTAGSSSYNQQRVASVVSHELAHMWFGNLMTLSWWDDLWLNEGFASYVEYLGVDQYHPDWDMLGQFVVDDLQRVFRMDAKLSSHPIVQPVAHPNQITEIFDAISYSKGASVLRMLDNFMGKEEFRRGVRDFLRAYKYGSAVTNDLWRHLEKHTSLNISRIMDTWTRQMGYPVLNVRKISPTLLEVTQGRFLQDPSAVSGSDSPYKYTWDVPVTHVTSDHVERQLTWLYREMSSLQLAVNANITWVKLNVNQYGYYRVNYEEQMWNELIDLLMMDHQKLSPSDRASLLDDAFSLAGANLVPYSLPLRLCGYLLKEQHYIPWKTVSYHVAELSQLLLTTKAYPLFRKFVLQLVEPHVQTLGWEDNGGHLERRLRPVLLALACKSGSSSCLATAEERLKIWLQNSSLIVAPNLRTVVYKYGMQNAG
ncbi:Peptidase M1 membrane alanine aminopeptidase N-terminal, partial [Trinorchestia longiramus]